MSGDVYHRMNSSGMYLVNIGLCGAKASDGAKFTQQLRKMNCPTCWERLKAIRATAAKVDSARHLIGGGT